MIRCDGCGRRKDNVRLREKTLPSFHVERVRLCTPCARAGGWIEVTFDRGHAPSAVVSRGGDR